MINLLTFESIFSVLFSQFLRKESRVKTSTTIGFIAAILAAALTALPDVISKPIVDPPDAIGITPMDPLMLVFIIYLMTGIFFSIVTTLQKPVTVTKIKKSNLVIMVIYGIVSAVATVVFSFGLKETSGVNATILANSEIIFAIIIGMIIYKERLAKKETLPFVFVIIGTILFPIASDIFSSKWTFSTLASGDVLILISGFCYCLCTFIVKHVSKVRITNIIQVMSLAGAGFIFILMLIDKITLIVDPYNFSILIDKSFLIVDPYNFSILSIIGILGIGGSIMFFVMAVRRIGAVRTVLIYSASTIFGVTYCYMYLGEPINAFNISSIVMVMIGLYYLRNKIASS